MSVNRYFQNACFKSSGLPGKEETDSSSFAIICLRIIHTKICARLELISLAVKKIE